jgi:ankyrin repeat protein
VNATQEGGFTALHAAAQSGNVGLIRLLLDKGANPQPRTLDGKTPLTFAVDNKHEAVVKILQP